MSMKTKQKYEIWLIIMLAITSVLFVWRIVEKNTIIAVVGLGLSLAGLIVLAIDLNAKHKK